MKRFWLWLPRWVRLTLVAVTCLVLAVLLAAASTWWYLHPKVQRTDGVVYGQRLEKPLTMDVIRPANANGIGIAFMASGGWKSQDAGETPTWMLAPILRRGYTVFVVCHISQPEATVMEIIEDAHRGVRFLRHHAEQYEIDPDRIGVSGGSAGGHLSLMLATRGGPGNVDSADPIDSVSSVVQAVAIFYPPTDLLDLGDSTENPGDGGPPISFVEAFGPGATNMESWKEIGRNCSPIYHVTDALPPTLIYHGDADTLVPLEQSERFRDRASELGHVVELVVHPGGGHGWLSMLLDTVKFGDWFDKHLLSQSAE